jgi:hypothetical protein
VWQRKKKSSSNGYGILEAIDHFFLPDFRFFALTAAQVHSRDRNTM